MQMVEQEVAEEWLELFPISERELRRLLELRHRYDAIVHTDACPPECLVSEPDTGDNNKLIVGIFDTLEQSPPDEMYNLFRSALNNSESLIFQFGPTICISKGESFRENLIWLEACVSLLGRRGDERILEILYQSAIILDDTADPSKLINFIYNLAVAFQCRNQTFNSNNEGTNFVGSVSPSSFLEFLMSRSVCKDSISLTEWKYWATHLAPDVSLVVSSVFHHFLLGPDFEMKPNQHFEIPHFSDDDNKKCVSFLQRLKSYDSSISYQLGLMSLGGLSHILYNSDEHGLSFSIFQQALLGFCGPTLILIETTAGDVLGYFTEIPWKTSSEWFSGAGESFLFQLYPSWNVYNAVDSSVPKKHHQFLNNPNSSRQGLLMGLAVDGITSNTPRLHISKTLERCTASSVGVTFESGPLLSNGENFFDVDALEVWAVRIPDSATYERNVNGGKLRLAMIEESRRSYAHVDRVQFLDDFQSGAFFNHIFDHRQATRGRADFVAADDRRKGYYLQGKSPSKKHIREDETG